MSGLMTKAVFAGVALLSAAAIFLISSREMIDEERPFIDRPASANIDGSTVHPALVMARCTDGSSVTMNPSGEREACPNAATPSGGTAKVNQTPPDKLIQSAMDGSVLAMGGLLQDLHRCVAAKVPPEKDPANRCAWVQDQAPQLIRQLEARAQLGDTQAQSELRRSLHEQEQYQSSTANVALDPGSLAAGALAATRDEFDRARMVLRQLDEGEKPLNQADQSLQPVDVSMRGRPQFEPRPADVR